MSEETPKSQTTPLLSEGFVTSEEPRKDQTTLWIVGSVVAVVALLGCCLVAVVLAAIGMFIPTRVVSMTQVTSGQLLVVTSTPTPVFLLPVETLPPVPPPATAVPTNAPTATADAAQPPTEPPAAAQGSQGSVVLENIHLSIVEVLLDRGFPAGCTGSPPACTTAQDGYQFLSVFLIPVDLPEGQMLPYKSTLGEVAVEINTSEKIPLTVQMYNNATRNLTIGFEVPESATGFNLQWPGSDAIALTIDK